MRSARLCQAWVAWPTQDCRLPHECNKESALFSTFPCVVLLEVQDLKHCLSRLLGRSCVAVKAVCFLSPAEISFQRKQTLIGQISSSPIHCLHFRGTNFYLLLSPSLLFGFWQLQKFPARVESNWRQGLISTPGFVWWKWQLLAELPVKGEEAC